VESQKEDLKAKRQEFKDLESKLEKIRAKKEIEEKMRETKEKLKDLNKKISTLEENDTQLKFCEEELKDYSSFEELAENFKEEFIQLNTRKDENTKTLEALETRLKDLETEGTTTKKGSPSYLISGLIISLISLLLTQISSLAYVGIILGIVVASLYYVLRKEVVDDRNSVLISDLESRIETTKGEIINAQETIDNILKKASVGNATEFELKFQRYTKLKNKKKNLEDVIKTLLGDEDLDSLKSKRQKIYDKLAIFESQYKEYKEINIPDTEILDMEERHGVLEKEIRELKESYDRNIGGKDVLEKDDVDPVAIEEEIDFYEREYEKAVHKNKALKIALEVLTETAAEVQQEFAPKLSEIASEYLSKITNRRYSKASVDENLNIKIFSPELNDYVGPETLSAGTRDQIYFSLRVATAQILSQNKRPPIILDDPFHSFDKNRLENTIHMLKEISKETQVILFSHDFWYEKDASNLIYIS
jgi:DNA repair exonuclease SbcCD ATPase subunit